MLGTLLESRKRSPRRRAAMLASGFAHTVLLIVLVMTRAQGTADGMSKPIGTNVVYVAPKTTQPPRVVPRAPAPAQQHALQLSVLPPVLLDHAPIDIVLDASAQLNAIATTFTTSLLSASNDSTGLGNGDDVMTARTVDQQVALVPGQRPPRYPPMLERAGIAGDVVAQFIVDTTGRVERGSVDVQQATHAEFARAVQARLAALRFVPASVRGHAVRQLVEQRFHFEVVRR